MTELYIIRVDFYMSPLIASLTGNQDELKSKFLIKENTTWSIRVIKFIRIRRENERR